jgi:hypothetical protein
MKRKIAVLVAAPLAAGGLTLAGSAPAHACTDNIYKVTWNVAGVYERPSQDSFKIKDKNSGDRITGPAGWAHIPNEGNSWTKVWVSEHTPGARDGWMRDDALNYIG